MTVMRKTLMMSAAVRTGLHHCVLKYPPDQGLLEECELDVAHHMCVRAGDRLSCFASDGWAHAACIERKKEWYEVNSYK